MPGGTTPRYLELLEMLKGEYENMYQEISMSKHHRDDAEYKSKLLFIWGLHLSFDTSAGSIS